MPSGAWAARDRARSDTDRRRVGVQWGRPVGARPRRVAACLRVREACVAARARRDASLSCATLCLTVSKVRLQMTAERMQDVIVNCTAGQTA